MKCFPVVGALLCLLGCAETGPDQYATRAEAEADRVFARGWLPSIIPDSSHSIVTVNDPDLNTSTGEFRFEISELDAFTARLDAVEKDVIPHQRDHYRYWVIGYNPYEYRYQNSKWTLYIDEERGHCVYWMKLIPAGSWHRSTVHADVSAQEDG